jgi:hypothetical protein
VTGYREPAVEPRGKTYTLLGRDGKRYESLAPGAWGGHRGTKIYGRLACPAALRVIARGGYVRHRVFFADEETAIAAGYRPCGTCCKDRYLAWKARQSTETACPGSGTVTAGIPGTRPQNRSGPCCAPFS